MSVSQLPYTSESANALMALMRRLFAFCLKTYGADLKPDIVCHIPIELFLDWCEKHWEDIAKAVPPLKGEEAVYDYFRDSVVFFWKGPILVRHLWPHIVYQDRPAAKHMPKVLSTIVLVRWDDGHVFFKAVNETAIDNDGDFAAAVAEHGERLAREMTNTSLDQLHDSVPNMRQGLPADPEEALFGAFLSIIPQLQPAFRGPCENVMRVLQSMYRPAVPPALYEREIRRRALQRQATQTIQAASTEKSTIPVAIVGGFD